MERFSFKDVVSNIVNHVAKNGNKMTSTTAATTTTTTTSYTSTSTTNTDMDKLMVALSSLTSISSLEDILERFGLRDLPQAQKYGILFGCLTFTLTVGTVLTLLILGGSFKRIVEQAETGVSTIPTSVEARIGRPLLLERLLEARERMRKQYATSLHKRYVEKGKLTNLAIMLMNVAPDISGAKDFMNELVDEDDPDTHNNKNNNIGNNNNNNNNKDNNNDTTTTNSAFTKKELQKFLPEGYEEEYIFAYRKCQDKPGGAMISGEPEARFEAYARSYAGCGIHASSSYKRSYARMYEAVSCKDHETEKKYRTHWIDHPSDIVGRTIRLELLDADRHLSTVFRVLSGQAYRENQSYDPNEIWGFRHQGPFGSEEEMRNSYIFQQKYNEAAYAIVEYLTDRVIGVILLTNDDPDNLSITIDAPIVKPTSEGTVEQIEACFLLMDKLFALGYRRIQYLVDSMDTTGKKLAGRIGFTQEGVLLKHMIVKDSNRDSTIYGMLNSDWSCGARMFLFKKLHGDNAAKVDQANDGKESELETQNEFLKKQKAAKGTKVTGLLNG
eukprot:CAMPEP_0184859346 /NCGR_PEP_ID=MMETSP0580-20130426/4347_1 /TAXON_ID=1118495 /ORGANISM="Dactyliosolen fragilissimus" /LENGTH=555 /DNA_ID=CAMNT_0027355935 /DNA_START=195 /DNA_END=1862 /DNA_ORIENTATION=+